MSTRSAFDTPPVRGGLALRYDCFDNRDFVSLSYVTGISKIFGLNCSEISGFNFKRKI